MESENKSIPKNVPDLGKTPPREELISTAVKFLQNPKVQSSPLEQKRAFLTKKGLSNEEIQTAIQRSGITENDSQIVSSNSVPKQTFNQMVPLQTQQVSSWRRFRDVSAFAIIIGGVVYAIYSLYKKYIEPYFVHHQLKQDEKLSRMEKGINEINEEMKKNMMELQESVKILGDQLSEQNLKMATVSNNLAIYKAQTGTSGFSNSAFGELQAEITSVKGLLLSRKEFPNIPKNPPVIPSWQMKPKNLSPSSSFLSAENKKEESSVENTMQNGSGDGVESLIKPNFEKQEKTISNNDIKIVEQKELKESDDEEIKGELTEIHGETNSNQSNGQPVQISSNSNGFDSVAPAINGSIIPNHTSSMLVSPTKLNPKPLSGNGPTQLEGEEVD